MKRIFAAMFALAGLLLLPASPAWAHAASTSFLDLDLRGTEISGHWDIALRDIEEAIGLDANGDGQLTWGEVRGAQDRIEAYALQRLVLGDANNACTLQVRELRISEHLDGHYASLQLQGHCAQVPQALQIRYDLLFDLDALHRGLLKLDAGGGAITTNVFSPQHREIALEPGGASALRVFETYLREGLWHVWTGWDHLLFLAALFLPAATRRTRDGWYVADTLREPLAQSARIVTAFTIAHAATLSVAAMGWVHLPTRWVESAVAATVVFAALNNLIPMVFRGLPVLAVFFGLIHGSAIAGALMELGLPATGRVWALLAFNIGVELAQLALVVIVVPLGYVLRHRAIYRWGILMPGSVLVLVIGLIWLTERVFAVRIFGLI